MKNLNDLTVKELDENIASIWTCLRADLGSSELDLLTKLIELERELSGRFNE